MKPIFNGACCPQPASSAAIVVATAARKTRGRVIWTPFGIFFGIRWLALKIASSLDFSVKNAIFEKKDNSPDL
jgi:hypothetical protein